MTETKTTTYINILYEITRNKLYLIYVRCMYIYILYIYNVRICVARGSLSNVHYVPSISNYVRKTCPVHDQYPESKALVIPLKWLTYVHIG